MLEGNVVQEELWVFSSDFETDRVSLFNYARLVGLGASRYFPPLRPSCRSTGIPDTCYHVQFYVGSGDFNSGPNAYAASLYPCSHFPSLVLERERERASERAST